MFFEEQPKEVLKPVTLKNYFSTERYIKRFLKEMMDIDNIPLSKLNSQFITEFEFFLRRCILGFELDDLKDSIHPLKK